mgnify:CR=1 FL=1
MKTVVETLHTITVNQTSPKDSGLYKAVVTNTEGEASTEATVQITGKLCVRCIVWTKL